MDSEKNILELLGDRCAICLSEPSDNPALVDTCLHTFCFSCIMAWISVQTSALKAHQSDPDASDSEAPPGPQCPLCKAAIECLIYDASSPYVYRRVWVGSSRPHGTTVAESEPHRRRRRVYFEAVVPKVYGAAPGFDGGHPPAVPPGVFRGDHATEDKATHFRAGAQKPPPGVVPERRRPQQRFTPKIADAGGASSSPRVLADRLRKFMERELQAVLLQDDVAILVSIAEVALNLYGSRGVAPPKESARDAAKRVAQWRGPRLKFGAKQGAGGKAPPRRPMPAPKAPGGVGAARGELATQLEPFLMGHTDVFLRELEVFFAVGRSVPEFDDLVVYELKATGGAPREQPVPVSAAFHSAVVPREPRRDRSPSRKRPLRRRAPPAPSRSQAMLTSELQAVDDALAKRRRLLSALLDA